jgi:hypothetical protein
MKRLPIVLLLLLLLTACARSGVESVSDSSASRVSPAAQSVKSNTKVADVRLHTGDGLTLCGHLFGRGETGVVLAHMFPADQESWSGFARELAESGDYTVLTFNFRGYGLSGGRKDIAAIDKDMLAALRYMKKRSRKVFLIGASMGGTAALRVASENKVAGVATLSAPREFQGLSVGNKLDRVSGHKLFIAAGGDGQAPDAAREFYGSVTEPRELEIVDGAAHGTNLLNEPAGTAGDLLKTWLAQNR